VPLEACTRISPRDGGGTGMTTERYDWRPPTERDWDRLKLLLDRLAIRLRMDADAFEQAQMEITTASLRPIATVLRSHSGAPMSGREKWYQERALRDRELADQVEDELGALRWGGDHQRKLPLDDHGMFPSPHHRREELSGAQ
jgi:hypothetical protein